MPQRSRRVLKAPGVRPVTRRVCPGKLAAARYIPGAAAAWRCQPPNWPAATTELARTWVGAGSRRLAGCLGLAPKDAGGVAVDLVEQVVDVVRRCEQVVDVESELRSRQYRVQELWAAVWRRRAIGKLVQSGPKSSRQGERRSTIVRCLGAIWHSKRTWWRVCSGTRTAHRRCTRAMSSSGRPRLCRPGVCARKSAGCPVGSRRG